MADGQFRFQHQQGQQFYSHFNNNSRHLNQRPASPTTSNRRPFSSDAPSPSRSPGPRSPSNLAYSMYTQGHAGLNSHGMINGGGHQRFGNQLNLNKFQHHNPHQHNQHGQSSQDPGQHGAHQGNFISHQHNQSGGGAGHFGGTHMQNGTPANAFSSTTKPHTEHYQRQVEIASEIRSLTHAHPHARNASNASKTVMPSNNLSAKGDDKDERNRNWEEDQQEKSVWTEIDLGGSNLRSVSLELFSFYPFLTKLFLNNNRLDNVPPQIGQLRNLKHLDLSINRISELPAEMGMLVKLQSLLLVDNNLKEIPGELGNLFALEMLAVEGNPLEDYQSRLIMEEGPAALIAHLRETWKGPDPPMDREWISFDDSETAPGEKFSVVSFNILCQQSGTPTQFRYTPTEALDWEWRKKIILEEICNRNADIVCLQEMDQENYGHLFRETLAMSDYKGVYWPRPRAKTISDERGKLVDGCATFIKNNKYIILDKHLVDYMTIAINRADMKGDDDVFNRVMPRDNIAVVLFLENRYTGSRLIVVNTHLHWNTDYRDVKVVQAAILMEETAKLAEKWAKWPPTPDKDKIRFRYANGDKPDGQEGEEEVIQEPVASISYERGIDIPIIVAGDFNSTVSSGVYEMLTTGQLSPAHKDLTDPRDGKYRKYGDITKHGVRHPFHIESAYGKISELPFTNYTPGFVGVLDYIFYGTSNLTCTGLLGEVDRDYLKRVPGFPNVHFPSDHLLLYAEFKSKPRKEPRKVTEVDFGPQKERRAA